MLLFQVMGILEQFWQLINISVKSALSIYWSEYYFYQSFCESILDNQDKSKKLTTEFNGLILGAKESSAFFLQEFQKYLNDFTGNPLTK